MLLTFVISFLQSVMYFLWMKSKWKMLVPLARISDVINLALNLCEKVRVYVTTL